MTEADMMRGGALDLRIGAFEIVKLEFTTDGGGVELRGHDQFVDPGADYDDELIGGAGDDLIRDFHGDNLLRGGDGSDTIIGGLGADSLRGGAGDDLLIGGGGVNQIFGGAGNDTLVGSDAGGLLQGGAEGTSHFVVSIMGDTVVEGFRPDEGSMLSFRRGYDRIEDVRDTLDIEGEDIVLRHETGMTRLVGAAGRIDHFEGALADFQTESPLHDVVDALLAETPDGTPLQDPEPAAIEPDGLLTDAQFHDLLKVETAAGLAAKLDGLEPDQISEFADTLNPTIYAYATDPDILATLLSRLDDATLADFFARLAPDAIGEKMVDAVSSDAVPEAFVALDDTALTKWLDNIAPDTAAVISAELSDAARATLDARLTSMGKSADDFGLSPEAANVAPMARGVLPEEIPMQDIEDEEEIERTLQDQQDARVAAEGGGCFIATVAYADPFHSDVVYLRRFRERALRPYRAGRLFIRAYNAGGPVLAKTLRPYPRGRRAVRWLLSRFVVWLMANEVARANA
jgi:hypothetical protein